MGTYLDRFKIIELIIISNSQTKTFNLFSVTSNYNFCLLSRTIVQQQYCFTCTVYNSKFDRFQGETSPLIFIECD